eukprot:NODE_820_length_1842_cov_107.103790_g766_i0.p1 GENE.NODE_820_length_1842_cov_107.103790_g766_i0~~NODE_820_length_1842_cov_107.103790_g766_i0.p1  ORF type:complete len:574 (-),score=150.31 NODE_820_length_1842_cov_107.103790_g766_i0:45-1766(-)
MYSSADTPRRGSPVPLRSSQGPTKHRAFEEVREEMYCVRTVYRSPTRKSSCSSDYRTATETHTRDLHRQLDATQHQLHEARGEIRTLREQLGEQESLRGKLAQHDHVITALQHQLQLMDVTELDLTAIDPTLEKQVDVLEARLEEALASKQRLMDERDNQLETMAEMHRHHAEQLEARATEMLMEEQRLHSAQLRARDESMRTLLHHCQELDAMRIEAHQEEVQAVTHDMMALYTNLKQHIVRLGEQLQQHHQRQSELEAMEHQAAEEHQHARDRLHTLEAEFQMQEVREEQLKTTIAELEEARSVWQAKHTTLLGQLRSSQADNEESVRQHKVTVQWLDARHAADMEQIAQMQTEQQKQAAHFNDCNAAKQSQQSELATLRGQIAELKQRCTEECARRETRMQLLTTQLTEAHTLNASLRHTHETALQQVRADCQQQLHNMSAVVESYTIEQYQYHSTCEQTSRNCMEHMEQIDALQLEVQSELRARRVAEQRSEELRTHTEDEARRHCIALATVAQQLERQREERQQCEDRFAQLKADLLASCLQKTHMMSAVEQTLQKWKILPTVQDTRM